MPPGGLGSDIIVHVCRHTHNFSYIEKKKMHPYDDSLTSSQMQYHLGHCMLIYNLWLFNRINLGTSRKEGHW